MTTASPTKNDRCRSQENYAELVSAWHFEGRTSKGSVVFGAAQTNKTKKGTKRGVVAISHLRQTQTGQSTPGSSRPRWKASRSQFKLVLENQGIPRNRIPAGDETRREDATSSAFYEHEEVVVPRVAWRERTTVWLGFRTRDVGPEYRKARMPHTTYRQKCVETTQQDTHLRPFCSPAIKYTPSLTSAVCDRSLSNRCTVQADWLAFWPCPPSSPEWLRGGRASSHLANHMQPRQQQFTRWLNSRNENMTATMQYLVRRDICDYKLHDLWRDMRHLWRHKLMWKNRARHFPQPGLEMRRRWSGLEQKHGKGKKY